MARRNRRSRGSTQRAGAISPPHWIANPRVAPTDFYDWLTFALPPVRPPRPVDFLPDLVPDLVPFEDRRLWSPDRLEPARRLPTGQAHFRVAPPPAKRSTARLRALLWPSHQVAFQQPERVAVCIRRQRRREVLHALNVAGSRGLRPPRRSQYTGVSCRR